MEKRARELERLGNYQSAIKIYADLQEKTKNYDDRYYYSQKIKAANFKHSNVSKLYSGQAFFPVFVQKNNSGAIFTIKFVRNIQNSCGIIVGNLTKNWEEIKPLLVKFLNNYLEKNLKNYLVFDWNLDEYFPCIEKFPDQQNNEELYEMIEGNSLQLALIFAFLSYFLNITLSNYVFTGTLTEDGDTVKINSVNEIQAKLDITKIERPKALLICNSNIGDSELRSFDNLETFITKMLPNFNKLLTDSIEKSTEKKISYIYVKTIKNVQSVDGKTSTLLRFNHTNMYGGMKLLNFFRQNLELFSPAAEGVIIDGLKPAFAVGLLAGMEEIKNTISGFIAVRNTQNDLQSETSAVVIKNGPNSLRKAGETFRYYNSI